MRRLAIPAWATTSGVGVAGLVAAGTPQWIPVIVAATPVVWLMLVVVLVAASVFCKDPARQDSAYRTLVLITTLHTEPTKPARLVR